MMHKSLIIYFVILTTLCTGFIVGALALGEKGTYLAQGYMVTPAIAAIITRLFFHEQRFRDANLRFGRIKDYLKFWLISVGITALSYVFFTLFGSITWDITGQAFLDRLAHQFESVGQDMVASLPPGLTPRMMLMIYFIGGLTVFNILPGLITGFGEEFGHRGLMFPALYRIKPWIGLFVGGLIWFAWHLPLALVIPQPVNMPLGERMLNFIILGAGSICTFVYLAHVYVKSQSVWVTSLAHIAMNNSASSFSYFIVLQKPFLANVGLTMTMLIVVLVLYHKNELMAFSDHFERAG